MFSSTFTPTKLAYLRSDGALSSLALFDLEKKADGAVIQPLNGGDTEENLTAEQKLRRERARNLSIGITTFIPKPKEENIIIIPQCGDLYMYDTNNDAPLTLVLDGSCVNHDFNDITFSPDGTYLSFVSNDNLYVWKFVTASPQSKPIQLTFTSSKNSEHSAVADYIAQEEFDRSRGYFWSPCSRYIAYERFSDKDIELYTIPHTKKKQNSVETHKYPFAGEQNVKVEVCVLDLGTLSDFISTDEYQLSKGGQSAEVASFRAPLVQLSLGDNEDIYLVRVDWASVSPTSSPVVTLQLLNRAQSVLALVAFPVPPSSFSSSIDPARETKESSDFEIKGTVVNGYLLQLETSCTWVNTHYLLGHVPFSLVPPSFRSTEESADSSTASDEEFYFIWGSEASGHMNLSLRRSRLRDKRFRVDFHGVPLAIPVLDESVSEANFSIVQSTGEAAEKRLRAEFGTLESAIAAISHKTTVAGSAASNTNGAVKDVPQPTGMNVEGAEMVNANNLINKGDLASEVVAKAFSESMPVICKSVCYGSELLHFVAGGAYQVEALRGIRGIPSGSGEEDKAVVVFFEGTRDSVLERHLYMSPIFIENEAISIEGSSTPNISNSSCYRITAGCGMHTTVVHPSASYFVDGLSTLHCLPSLSVYTLDPLRLLESPPLPELFSSIPEFLDVSHLLDGSPQVGSPFLNPISNVETLIGSNPNVNVCVNSSFAPPDLGISWPFNSIVAPAKTGSYGFIRENAEKSEAGNVEGATKATCHASLISVLFRSLPGAALTIPANWESDIRFWINQGLRQSPREKLKEKEKAKVPFSLSNLITRICSPSTDPETASPPQVPKLEKSDPSVSTPSSNEVNFAPLIVAVHPTFGLRLHSGLEPSNDTNSNSTPSESGDPIRQEFVDLSIYNNMHVMYMFLHLPRIYAYDVASSSSANSDSSDGRSQSAKSYAKYDISATRNGHPVVAALYGGPHVQRASFSAVGIMEKRPHALARCGLITFTLDNRGSSRRGLAFESSIYRRMGTLETADQALVMHLLQTSRYNLGQVGKGGYVTGWSYGGYMTLMCLARWPRLFQVGVAGAPVTDWQTYDTGYTERYMSLPQLNTVGYADGSVLSHCSGIRGKLLLIHGLLDENVLVRHTFLLINELVKHNILHDLIILPNERHGPRGTSERAFIENRSMEYFEKYLSFSQY